MERRSGVSPAPIPAEPISRSPRAERNGPPGFGTTSTASQVQPGADQPAAARPRNLPCRRRYCRMSRRSTRICANGITASSKGAPRQRFVRSVPIGPFGTLPFLKASRSSTLLPEPSRCIDRAVKAGGQVALFAHAHVLRSSGRHLARSPPPRAEQLAGVGYRFGGEHVTGSFERGDPE